MANHASTRTTQLYDRRRDEVSLDEVERKVRVKQGRKGGPNREVKREKSEKGQLRPALDDAAKSRRRAGNCPPLRNASAPEGFASRILHWSAAYRPPMRLRLG